jgi:hypothetical protein
MLVRLSLIVIFLLISKCCLSLGLPYSRQIRLERTGLQLWLFVTMMVAEP